MPPFQKGGHIALHLSVGMSVFFMPPFQKGGHIALHLSVGMSVCRSVCR